MLRHLARQSEKTPVSRPERAKTCQPRATPWECVPKKPLALKGHDNRVAPLLRHAGSQGDVVGIDAAALGATSTAVDVVNRAWFLCNPNQSQFVYERATGNLYYDKDPSTPGYTGLLANLSQSSLDPATSIVVL